MILVVLAIWFGYKKGRDTGRNPFLWAAISAGAFIGAQIVVGIVGATVLTIMTQGFDWLDRDLGAAEAAINVLAIIASFLALWMVFRYLDKIPKDNENYEQPPPPPKFDNVE